jgi:hypothetical protein
MSTQKENPSTIEADDHVVNSTSTKESINYLQIVVLSQEQKIIVLQQNLTSLQSQIDQQNSQLQLLQSKLDYLMNK